jgi:AcrR family transcriptional regulator
MEQQNQWMRISELSEHAGVPIPKIRYYILKEILPRPLKIKRTLAYYGLQHLERLKLLKKITHEKRVPIALIKQIFASINEIEGNRQISYPNASQIVRDKITHSSTSIFRRKGYERTTITDITMAAGISRNTFYNNFKNKEELFIECLNKIFFDWRKEAPPEENGTPIFGVIKKMALAFNKAYPEWSDMINLLRVSAMKHPATFADRLEESLNIRIRPIVNDIKRGIKHGEFREVNSELVGIMLAGIAEYVSYYLSRGKFKEPSKILDTVIDTFFRGLRKE